jgi:hypothetical protein
MAEREDPELDMGSELGWGLGTHHRSEGRGWHKEKSALPKTVCKVSASGSPSLPIYERIKK